MSGNVYKRHGKIIGLERLGDSDGQPVWRITIPYGDYGAAVAMTTNPGAHGSEELDASWVGESVEMSLDIMGRVNGIALLGPHPFRRPRPYG